MAACKPQNGLKLGLAAACGAVHGLQHASVHPKHLSPGLLQRLVCGRVLTFHTAVGLAVFRVAQIRVRIVPAQTRQRVAARRYGLSFQRLHGETAGHLAWNHSAQVVLQVHLVDQLNLGRGRHLQYAPVSHPQAVLSHSNGSRGAAELDGCRSAVYGGRQARLWRYRVARSGSGPVALGRAPLQVCRGDGDCSLSLESGEKHAYGER